MDNILELRAKLDCVTGDCPKDHDGICIYDGVRSTYENKLYQNDLIEIAILKARQDEAEGFEHGGDEWTSNGGDVDGEAPSGWDRRQQLQARIDELEAKYER